MTLRRPLHRLTALAVLVALATLVTGCGGDDDAGSARPSTTTTSDDVGDAEAGDGTTPAPDETTGATLELTPAPTTTTTPEDRAMSDLLLDDVPLEGFSRADEALGAGPLDLDAAAAAENDAAAERALLETRGFERGVSRAWLDPGQDVVYVAVYDFADVEGAAAYLADGAETLRARGAIPFDVPEVAGAVGFTTIEESSAGTFTAHVVAFPAGDRWVLTLVGSADSGMTPDDARAVAAAQAARLR